MEHEFSFITPLFSMLRNLLVEMGDGNICEGMDGHDECQAISSSLDNNHDELMWWLDN